MDRDRPWDLVARIAEFVMPTEPRALAEVTLSELAIVAKSRRVALFSRGVDVMQLFTSRGVDEPVLELVRVVWRDQRDVLEAGRSIFASHPGETQEFQAALRGVTSLGIFPLRASDRLIGVLYVDTTADALDEARISKLTPLAVVALGTPVPGGPPGNLDTYLGRTSRDEIDKDQLLLLLNNNEWNIARVSRLMGLTRRTIYKKLDRYGIERQKIRKAQLKAALAAKRR